MSRLSVFLSLFVQCSFEVSQLCMVVGIDAPGCNVRRLYTWVLASVVAAYTAGNVFWFWSLCTDSVDRLAGSTVFV